MVRAYAARVVAVIVIGLTMACGDEASPSVDGPGGDEPVVWAHEEASGNKMEAEVKGEVGYRSPGCFTITRDANTYPVVWPYNTRGVADGPGVELPDGTTARVGDTVYGGGGSIQPDDPLVEDFDIPADCLPETGEVSVFNSTGDVTVER